jgi:hypothetical protein
VSCRHRNSSTMCRDTPHPIARADGRAASNLPSVIHEPTKVRRHEWLYRGPKPSPLGRILLCSGYLATPFRVPRAGTVGLVRSCAGVVGVVVVRPLLIERPFHDEFTDVVHVETKHIPQHQAHHRYDYQPPHNQPLFLRRKKPSEDGRYSV